MSQAEIHLPPDPSLHWFLLPLPILAHGTTIHPVAQTEDPGGIMIASVSAVPTPSPLGGPVESLSNTYSNLDASLVSTTNTLSRAPSYIPWALVIDS